MNSFSFRCASWPSSLSQSPKMQHGKITVIQAFIIREVIMLLLRFTSFASRFANSEEYDIFRFSKSPAGLLTWQLGQTPDLKSVGKCQNPHPGRALPINFQQVAWPPHPTPPHPTPPQSWGKPLVGAFIKQYHSPKGGGGGWNGKVLLEERRGLLKV